MGKFSEALMLTGCGRSDTVYYNSRETQAVRESGFSPKVLKKANAIDKTT